MNQETNLLARLAKGRTESNTISSLLDDKQTRHHKTSDINKIMMQFYQKLYSSECEFSEGRRKEFLDRVSFPSLSEEQRENLTAPVTEKEVHAAIASLRGGKAPGPDGFCPEFYKKLKHLLVRPLTDMYLDSFETGRLPPTLNIANTTLILKKDKPPDVCGSFRPISLINVDNKLLSKLLAARLEKLLPFLINTDQTGFIQGRLSVTNVRRLLNVIQYSKKTNHGALAVSLDTEKAFDRVEWEYIFDALERFGLGGDFLKWIKVLYSSPQACVVTGGMQSPPFPLRRGTNRAAPCPRYSSR